MPNFCGECGAEVAGKKFCTSCGKKLESKEEGHENDTRGLSSVEGTVRPSEQRCRWGEKKMEESGHVPCI